MQNFAGITCPQAAFTGAVLGVGIIEQPGHGVQAPPSVAAFAARPSLAGQPPLNVATDCDSYGSRSLRALSR